VLALSLAGLLAASLHVHVVADQTAQLHCPVCVAMHSAAPVAPATVVLIVFAVAATVAMVAVAAHRCGDVSSNLFVRPPPIS
jgi:hypothetical protein